MYDQIAIALDDSLESLAAAAFARHLTANCYHVIHVVEPGAPLVGRLGRSEIRATAARQQLSERLREATLAALTPNGETVPHLSVELRDGDPVEQLIAASEPADMIVLTTRGRGVAGRTIFGSVADAVSRRGIRPTLLIRPDHDLRRPERIVVPLDGKPRAELAIPVARELADSLGCPLILVHVVDQDSLDETPFGTDALVRDHSEPEIVPDDISAAIYQAAAYLREHELRLEQDGTVVQHRVVIGETIPALIEFSDPADIVVVGSRAITGLRRLVDQSVAEHLVRHAPAPVLIIHEGTREPDDEAISEA